MLAVVPLGANAQTYAASLEPFTYVPMPLPDGGPVSLVSSTGTFGGDAGPTTLAVPLPFTFDFYGQPYTSVNVLGSGMVTFGSSYTTMVERGRAIPGTASPHNFIAVWWDRMVCENSTSSALSQQVVGQPGNQAFVLEWKDCRRYAGGNSSKANAQLWLYENGVIEARYGTLADPNHPSGTFRFRATMGIENGDGTDGTPGLPLSGTQCNPECSLLDFPTNHRIIYSSGPAVTMESVTVTPQPVNIGYPLEVSALVTNNRSRLLDDAAVRYWMGPTPLISQAQEIGTVSGVDIAGNTSVSFPLNLDTSGFTPGTYYVIAEFDPDNAIFPVGEAPVLVSTPFTVKVPTAALRVLGGTVSAPGWVESGATFDVTWEMDNRELLEAVGAEFSVVLSSDTTVDAGDVVIGSGFFSLGSNGQISVTRTVTVPETVADGRYFVGVWLDPAEAIPHVDRSGNKRMSVTPTTVGLELEIVTAELPGGRVGEPYAANLVATGGDNTYAWSVVAGTLPAGLSIGSAGGVHRLAGTPDKAGVSTFTLQATSGQFTETATYTVEVLPALVALEVVTSGNLPNATLGSAYSVVLEARGGNPPYTWSLESGSLPAGLTLSESGRFGGTPTEQGSFPIFLRLSDTVSSISAFFSLEIGVDPLACADVKNHAPVMAGEAIHPILLMASGGKAPYAWATVSGAVPGLAVSAAGEVSGTPTTAGTYDWTVEVTDDLTSKKRCHVNLEVTEQPKEVELKIATTTLPRGQVLEAYEATLAATDFTGTVTWTMGVDGDLPEGLLLTSAGKIEGMPAVSALGGEKTRTFRFEVVATDSAQKVARATLELELFDDRPPAPPVETIKTKKEGGGCQSTSGDAGLLGLGLALGVATLIRRHRR